MSAVADNFRFEMPTTPCVLAVICSCGVVCACEVAGASPPVAGGDTVDGEPAPLPIVLPPALLLGVLAPGVVSLG